MKEKEQYRREELEKMTSQQLDDVLCTELGKECPDRNVVLGILEILEEREADAPLPEDPKVIEAKAFYRGWDEGASFERKNKAKKKHWIANAAVIALVLLMFTTMAPKALGAENLFDLFARWTESIFAFFGHSSAETTAPELEYEFRTDNPGLQELYDTVTELGITQRVVPQWLPEGYELERIKVDRTRDCVKIHACFVLESQEISISIRLLVDSFDAGYFKDETNVEIFECGGVLHYIMGNESVSQAAWCIENIECLLHITYRPELQQIIESVYNGE